MKRKIVGILICMLLCVSVSAVTGTEEMDANPNILTSDQESIPNRAPWDLLAIYDIGGTGASGANGNSGGEYDGIYLYSTRWESNLIHQYDLNGDLVKEFSIPGVSGLRDLAWDGQYMYGGAAGSVIWQMDFNSETLIGTITGGFQCRAIAYNSDSDTFYVSNWNDPAWEIDRSGNIVDQFNLGVSSTYGFAYDPDPAGPYLWVWDQGGGTGQPQYIHQWDLTAGAMTGFSYDVSQDVGTGQGIAGGLWLADDYQEGLMCIGGTYQDGDSPGGSDMIFVYELYTTNAPPETPGAPDGPDEGLIDEEYTFSAVTTDPNGDKIRYMFDWGDGTFSEWSGLENSGIPVEESHAWDEVGDYDVKVKAKDENDAESDWSPAHTITIVEPKPALEIGEIWGGLFKVSAKIKNTGDADANGVQWSIELSGGIILLGKTTTGTVNIPAGGVVTVQSNLIIGFGSTKITVTAEVPESSDTKSKSAFVLFIYISM